MFMEIQAAVAKVHKYATSESGDTLETIERPNGGLSMVLADGLMILPPSDTRYVEGARIKVQLLHTDAPVGNMCVNRIDTPRPFGAVEQTLTFTASIQNHSAKPS